LRIVAPMESYAILMGVPVASGRVPILLSTHLPKAIKTAISNNFYISLYNPPILL
jgi:hypothetical protein